MNTHTHTHTHTHHTHTYTTTNTHTHTHTHTHTRTRMARWVEQTGPEQGVCAPGVSVCIESLISLLLVSTKYYSTYY
jgi:ABC-type nickel/cobalt efflux system permease component RcnA